MKRIPEPVEIIRHSEYQVSLVLNVEPDLAFFPGHFPVQSVLPGVVMVDWAVSFAQLYLPLEFHFTSMEAIKFKQVVRPPQQIRLHLDYRADKQKLMYKIDSDIGEHSSGKINGFSLKQVEHV